MWVGADDDLTFPLPDVPENPRFTAFCYSSYLALHGMEYIVEAAHILQSRGEAVHFLAPGKGHVYPQTVALAKKLGVKNMEFTDGWIPLESIPRHMAESSVCLGIFGASPKTQRVIPHKVFDALAMRRPVITADTPGAREALTHGENAWLCEPGSGEALAEAILTLKRDPELRRRLAENGYRLYREKFSIDALRRDISEIIAHAPVSLV